MDISIPLNLLKANDIPAEYKIIYGLLAGFAYKKGYCWHSNANLEEQTGNTDRTIRRALKALEDANYITVVHNTKAKDPLYDNRRHKRVIWIREKYLIAKDNLKHERRKAKIANKLALEEFKAQTTEKQYSQPYFMRINGMFNQPVYLGVDREGVLYTYDMEYDEKYVLETNQNDMWANLYQAYLKELNK